MNEQNNKKYKGLQLTARIMIAIWTGFWLYFAIMSSIAEKMAADILFVGTIILIPAIFAWIWENIGSWFILFVGLIIAIGYPIMFSRLALWVIILTDVTLSIIPITAGLLLIIRQRKLKKLQAQQG